ncbi:MAG: PTS sugar transporter subunit IIB [Clostridium sp.]
MKNIMLVCSAGMSTSLLVTKMQKAAEEQGVEAKIWAVGTGIYTSEKGNCDVILLGPQVRFMKAEVARTMEVPVEVIDMRIYGKMDGAGALAQALKMME